MQEAEDRAFLGRGWAFPGTLDGSGEVAMSAYEEDVRQSIWILLGTNRGERVMRPDFGSGLREMVFEPNNTTTRALVRHRVEETLVTWEPRIDQIEVEVSGDPASARLDVAIRYRVRSTNSFYNLVYPFYLQEGRPT